MVKTSKLYNSLIWFVSVLVPIVVAVLLFTKWSQDKLIFDMVVKVKSAIKRCGKGLKYDR